MSVMGRDDSWPSTMPSVVPTGDCSTDPFTTFTGPTGLFLSEWAKCRSGNTQNGRTVHPTANLIADSESGSPSSHSRFIVTVHLSRLVSEIFTCDRQTDRRTTRTITIAGPRIVTGQLINTDKDAETRQNKFSWIGLGSFVGVLRAESRLGSLYTNL